MISTPEMSLIPERDNRSMDLFPVQMTKQSDYSVELWQGVSCLSAGKDNNEKRVGEIRIPLT